MQAWDFIACRFFNYTFKVTVITKGFNSTLGHFPKLCMKVIRYFPMPQKCYQKIHLQDLPNIFYSITR